METKQKTSTTKDKEMQTLKELWNATCLSAGIPAISTDTAARIMAVTYTHGNNEAFVFNPNFVADLDYICKRFHIHGAGTPNLHFAELLRKYVSELETFEKAHEGSQGGALFKPHVPQWAVELFKDRYNIKLIN